MKPTHIFQRQGVAYGPTPCVIERPLATEEVDEGEESMFLVRFEDNSVLEVHANELVAKGA